MKAPWEEFPEFKRGCMGWRMGGGEGYLDEFVPYLKSLSEKEFIDYLQKHPEPELWKGCLTSLRN